MNTTRFRKLAGHVDAPLVLRADETRIFVGHDYMPNGREPLWESSVAAQKAGNIHLTKYPAKPEFVAFREARDLNWGDALVPDDEAR